ncbi:GGDEF domain-containing protein [Clostridium paraputrificum]|uniref:GGDEF domain-containing protein n=1 Tax=Clostridium TaxID=1485 RepID=UPI003D357F44
MLIYDQLTNSQNRLGLEIKISELISSRNKRFSMIFIDLDYFKTINDTYGHAEGDIALKNVVSLFKLTFKNTGQVFRMGGDEFVILVYSNKADRLERLIHKLHMTFDRYNQDSRKPYTLQFSYGYDIFNSNFNNIEEYLSHIDNLMYNNKKSKKAR